MATHSRTFRLTDKALQIVDSQENKTQFVIDAIINSQAVPEDHKRCYKCGSILPHACFDRDKSKKDGMSNLCKNCKAIKNSNAR